MGLDLDWAIGSGGIMSCEAAKKATGSGVVKRATSKKSASTKKAKASGKGKPKAKSSLRVVASKSKAKKKSTVQSEEERVAQLILDHRENGRKLARSILRRWRVRMPTDEIDSIVDLALCEAARRYSEERGATFMTFFFYHLRGHLVRSVARAAQANNIFMAFAQNIGIDPGDWHHVNNEVIWTYAPDTMIFGQRDAETPEHNVLRKEKLKQCREAITKLDELEQEIIYRSFQSEQPLVNIARSLGYSRCHVSRVKKAALERLKVILEETADGVRPYDGGRELNAGSMKSPVLGRGRTKRRGRRRSIGRNERLSNNRSSANQAA